MKKFLTTLLAFLIPIIIMIVIFWLKNVYPFGNFSPRIYDSYYQYTAFFIGLKNFKLYSFQAGLGFNFLATAAYYLMSPINILFLFSNVFNIDLIFMIIILIKIGLSGSFMYILLKSESKKYLTPLLFSIIYALSGFITCYFYNIMWLDSIYMVPLVIMGINRIFNHKSSLFYIIILFLTIIFNFYTGYMVCIFSLLYFIFKYVNTDKIERAGLIPRFIIASLLVGGLSSIILIPAFFGLLQGKASGFGSSYTNYYAINNNILYFFNKLSPGSFFSGDQAQGPYQIYSSLFCVVLFIMSLLNTKFTKKYRLSLVIFLIIFIISFGFNGADYMWQFFQKPVWWNHRYSFLFSFMIIYFAFKNYQNYEGIKYDKYYFPLIIISTILLFTISFYMRYIDINNIKTKIFIVIMFAITILYLLSYFMLTNYKRYKVFIVILLFIELGLNALCSISNNVSGKSVESINVYDKALTASLDNIKDDSFYRLELINRHLYNDGLSYGYNGINYFNSVRNQNYINFAEYYANFKVDSHCSSVINYFDPLLISLLNVKYLIGSDVSYLEPYYDNNSFSIYKNQNNLNIGFMVNEKVKDTELIKNDHLSNITNIINNMINENVNYYEDTKDYKFKYEVNNGRYENNEIIADDIKTNVVVNISFTAEKDGLIVPVNNEFYNKYTNIVVNDHQYISNGSYIAIAKNDKVVICINYDSRNYSIKDFEFKLMNLINTTNVLGLLKNNMLELNNDNRHLLSGKVISTENKNQLFLSIPYENGFKITVDGKRVNYEKAFNTFIIVDVPIGEHEITIDYFTPGLKEGIIISAISLLLTAGLVIVEKKRYN